MTTTSLIIICVYCWTASLRPASSRPSSMSAWSGGPGRTSVGRCRSRSRSAGISVALVGRDGGARLAHPLRNPSAEASCRQPGEAVSRPRLASGTRRSSFHRTILTRPTSGSPSGPSRRAAILPRATPFRHDPGTAADRLSARGRKDGWSPWRSSTTACPPTNGAAGRRSEACSAAPIRQRSSSVCSRSGRPTPSPESTRSGALRHMLRWAGPAWEVTMCMLYAPNQGSAPRTNNNS